MKAPKFAYTFLWSYPLIIIINIRLGAILIFVPKSCFIKKSKMTTMKFNLLVPFDLKLKYDLAERILLSLSTILLLYPYEHRLSL